MEDRAELVNGRILVIDDNPAIHQDFEKILRQHPGAEQDMQRAEQLLFGDAAERKDVARPAFELHFAHQGQQGVEMAQRARQSQLPFAMAFIDMRMPPGWDGLETIERLWAVDPDVQVVVCSAHSDYDWADFIERLGHTDKLLVLKKPFEPIEVLQCASSLTRKWQDEQALRRQVRSLEHAVWTRTEGLEAANRKLRHLATHDSLTGLPNRVLLDDRLAQAIARSEDGQNPFFVLVFDLDRFKLVNDSLGHRAGDALLKSVAQRLRAIVGSLDTVARTGGDEFVMVLTSTTDARVAEHIAQRAIDLLQEPVRITGVDLHVSTSIGVACFPADAMTAENLVARADAAMYYAKQRGRNSLQRYEPRMDLYTRERVKLESELHAAIAGEQFEVYYQPKVDTASNTLHSAEALIRWRHPERGVVLPGEFIELAEECGLMTSLGEWVLREACRQCAAWQREGLPPLRVAVNVTATQFHQSNLLDVIREALRDSGLAANFLELELTESAVMTDPEASSKILEQLSVMGVLVSVDDFGTGYSSMSYLSRFPIDKLKIDRGFVKDLMSRTEDASIVQAIISLAHSLRLKVVAEGVETAEQLQWLRGMRCDQYQGFHFSPPVQAREFAELLRNRKADPARDDDAARTHSKLAALR